MKVLIKSLKTVFKCIPIYIILQIVIRIIDTAAVFILAKINGKMMNQLVDSILIHEVTRSLMFSLCLVIIINLLITCCKLLLNYFLSKSSIKYQDYLTLRIITKTKKLQYSFFDDPNKQNEFRQYLNDSTSILDLSICWINCLFNIISLILSIYTVLRFNWLVTLITILISFPAFFVRKKYKTRIMNLKKRII